MSDTSATPAQSGADLLYQVRQERTTLATHYVKQLQAAIARLPEGDTRRAEYEERLLAASEDLAQLRQADANAATVQQATDSVRDADSALRQLETAVRSYQADLDSYRARLHAEGTYSKAYAQQLVDAAAQEKADQVANLARAATQALDRNEQAVQAAQQLEAMTVASRYNLANVGTLTTDVRAQMDAAIASGVQTEAGAKLATAARLIAEAKASGDYNQLRAVRIGLAGPVAQLVSGADGQDAAMARDLHRQLGEMQVAERGNLPGLEQRATELAGRRRHLAGVIADAESKLGQGRSGIFGPSAWAKAVQGGR